MGQSCSDVYTMKHLIVILALILPLQGCEIIGASDKLSMRSLARTRIGVSLSRFISSTLRKVARYYTAKAR